MARQITLTLGDTYVQEALQVEELLGNHVHVHNLTKIVASSQTIFKFNATNRRARECVEALQGIGVGHRFGSMEIMEVKSVIPRMSNHPTLLSPDEKQREYSSSNSLTLEEIFETVERQYHLTFEYLANCACASLVCSVGLVTDSSPAVIASMLLSPLMGPLLGMTLGTAIRDWPLVIKSIRNELIGVIMTLLFGMVSGVIMSFYQVDEWETSQMYMRGTLGGLAPGVLVAIPCGIALAISVTAADAVALIGVAIAVALLPPIVDSGLELTYGLMKELPLEADRKPVHLLNAANSFLLFLLNWVAIYFGCLLVFAIKRVRPRIAHAPSRTASTSSRSSSDGDELNDILSSRQPLLQRP
eukprot:m.9430 g.9430  ORF g.9430 m.9430 type:complete len:358 (-) comp5453_c0_seq1:198-1271(-)